MAEIRAQRQHVAIHAFSARRARALERPDREAVAQIVEADAAALSRPMPQPELAREVGEGFVTLFGLGGLPVDSTNR